MSRVVYILNNPAYAGAYSYGRKMTVARPLPDNPTEVKKYEVLRNFEDWMLIRDRHEGYISWEQYLQNRERLADNCNWGRERPKRHRGAALAGNALLQGIVSCGACGRRMRVSYNHSNVKRYNSVPRHYYRCLDVETHASIQNIRGRDVDEAISCLLLQLLEPANLAVSVESLKRVESQVRHVGEQLELQLKEARYRADLERRRYDIVDPENRLVAADLERRWKECLEEVRRLERRLDNKDHQTLAKLSETEEAAVLALAGDLPRVWRSETTTVERKQLLRCLIKDVALTKSGQEVRARLRLQTGS